MTVTLPDGMEYKNLAQACADAVGSTGVWGSQFPEEDGVRNLIVAVTGVRDEVGDIIVPGAFEHTLQRIEPKGCMGHDWNRVTGYPEAIEEVMPGDPRLPKTDRFGKPWPAEAGALFVRHRYHTDTDDGQRAYKDARFLGPRLACSIGYVDPKDENGKPLYSYKKIDPVSGLMTRFLPRLDLFEYSQVLHGAHLMAGGLKTGRPKRLERKARPSMELKLRLVRDSAYWGLPLGTPIRPGMKPQGPKARRLVAAGQQANEAAGAVEIDGNDLSIKPTAKGKQKGQIAVADAFSGIMSLLGDDNADPFDESFLTDDTQKINKGEQYNPLDILVANAVRPIEVEEQLRDNSDWDIDRLGDAAERQDEIDSYIADVVDAYREKYNAELVRQNDTGDSEVAEPSGGSAEDTEVQPEVAEEDSRTVNEQEEDRRHQAAVDRSAGAPTQQQQRAQSEANRAASQRGELPLRRGESAPAAPAAETEQAEPRIAPEDQAAIDRLKRDGRDNEAAKLRRDAVQRARAAEGITPEQISPTRARLRQEMDDQAGPPSLEDGRTMQEAESGGQQALPPSVGEPAPSAAADMPEMAVHNGDPVNIRAVDGDTANVYNTRTEQAYDIPVSELLTGGASIDAPVALKLNEAQQEAADLAFGNDEPADVAGAEMTRDGLSVVNIAEALATIDARFEAFEDNPDQKRRHGRALKTVRTKIAKLAKPGDTGQSAGGAREPLAGNGDVAAEPSTEVAPEAGSGESTVEPGTAPGTPAGNTSAVSDLAQIPQDEFNQMLQESRVNLRKARDFIRSRERAGASVSPAMQAGYDQAEAHNNRLETENARRFDSNAARQQRFDALTPEQQDTFADLTSAGRTPDEALDEITGGAAQPEPGEPLGETDPGLAEAPLDEPLLDETAPESEPTEEVTPDEIADTEEAVDASFGVTEAPDGEFEVDADIADRQDRVASLLLQSEAGGLDLSRDRVSDDQLRTTRADIVDEIRLQQHLERRRAGERALTRQQAETQAADSLVPQEEADDAEPVETGPKPRPGVAGAAEDLADALDDGDQARIAEATDRLRKSVGRSRSDSEVVAEIRAMLDSGVFDPAALRDAAQRLRDEQRAKRNEGARRRRAARRFERERLRSLLGQVEAEMRTRNLDYDPLPDEDGTVTLEPAAAAPVAWETRNEVEGWSGFEARIDELSGSGYQASITTQRNSQPSYRWTVTNDDGAVLATGGGNAADVDSARAAVEIALDTQRRLGLIPVDAQIPQGSVPQNTSATPLTEVVDAVQTMRQRILDGRRLNPITGQPDPFADQLEPLAPPVPPLFDSAEAVRKYLERRATTGTRVTVDRYRWDTAKMTSGGAFVVVDDLTGRPKAVHSATGAEFGPREITLSRADLLQWVTIAEAVRDTDGRPVDWSKTHRELSDEVSGRAFAVDEEGFGRQGLNGIIEAATQRLTQEKLRSGAFTHKLVQKSSGILSGAVNPSRKAFVEDQNRALAQMINVRVGKPSSSDKKTLEVANGARVLATLGAPDVASVLLTRRATELREEFGGDAPGHGSALLDALALGYLGAYSPIRSHGERLRTVKPGEQIFLAERGEDEPQLRSFRVLAEPRRDPRGAPTDMIAPVIDEKTGEQKYLQVSVSQFRIEDTPEWRYGYTPLGGGLSGATVVVVGPGEEPPATAEDLESRRFDDVAAIPQDVLDAAAEVLPESASETRARRAAAPEGGRAPRRASARAPRRAAQEPAAPEPVRNEQQLATAQGRSRGQFLGMPFDYDNERADYAFDDLAAAREHLAALAADQSDPRRASSAGAVLLEIDNGESKLSPGGVFVVRKNGTVTHAFTGYSVWPPSPSTSRELYDDLYGGGYDVNQGAGLEVARALESGVFDGERIDWSGDGRAAIKQSNTISARNGKFHPIQTAQRAAYLDSVMNARKPRITDVQMLRGMVQRLGESDMPNPEELKNSEFAITPLLTYDTAGGFKGGSYTRDDVYTADSKTGAALAKRVALEVRIAEAVAALAPLDAVRRLNRVADDLDGQTINTVNVVGQRGAPVKGNAPKTLTPSDDLRAMARRITDAFDESKISESVKFRRAGMVGEVEMTSALVTVNRWGRTSHGPNDPLTDDIQSRIRDGKNLRFYRDENGMLHATFVGYDIADGQHSGRTLDGDSRALNGSIKLSPEGRLTISFTQASHPVMIESGAGHWKFVPETPGDDEDTSGPETASGQAGDGMETDTGAAQGGAEDQIRRLYKELADGPQDWVPLRKLRPRITGVDRAEVDRVLVEMTKTGLVHLVPSSNRKALTEDDHANAIRVGGEDKHLLAIEDE